MNLLKKRACVALIFVILLNGCGYKLGGLEVIGENSSKTAVLKVISSKEFTRKLKNSGFIIKEENFEYLIQTEGPFRKKETSSVSSSADDREFTLTVSMIVSIFNNSGETIIERKEISKSKDYDFSSSSINSSESEEAIIYSDIEKILQVEIINIIRSIM
tara:strand:+ start:13243 stop:13722 length:480 start_codon:yes stop_codon:yes gene_type:complete